MKVINVLRKPLQHCSTPLLRCQFATQSPDTSSSPAWSNLSQYRRGTGGRSSFNGTVATVFGASGFFGTYVVNQLGKLGSQVIIPHRCDPYDVKELRLMGDLGQILFTPLDPHNDDTIRAAVRHSNVVINLIGRDNETPNFKFDFVHVDLAARIARISREMGVPNLIHFSALNASLNPQPYFLRHGSGFYRSKAQGEVEVRREFGAHDQLEGAGAGDAGRSLIIVRPSDIWGQLDRFLFYYMRKVRNLRYSSKRSVPLWDKGRNTYKMPVSAYDLGKAVALLAQDPGLARGRTLIEAVGPHRYRLDHLVVWLHMHCRMSDREFEIISANHNPIYWAKVYASQLIMRRQPHLHWERLEREAHTDKLSSEALNLEDIGLTHLTRLEDRIRWEVVPLRQKNYYWDALGEFPDPPNPPVFASNVL